MPIKFAVKIVRLTVCVTIASQSDDPDLHSRSHVRLKLDYFLTCNISDNIEAITFKLGMAVVILMPYIPVLVLGTLTLMQGHNGSSNTISVACSRQLNEE